MSDYRMTCYNNIGSVLEANGLRFIDASTVPSFPSETIYRGGEILNQLGRELAIWRETAVLGVVEVTDPMSGAIYSLIGSITTAEELALTVALAQQA